MVKTRQFTTNCMGESMLPMVNYSMFQPKSALIYDFFLTFSDFAPWLAWYYNAIFEISTGPAVMVF